MVEQNVIRITPQAQSPIKITVTGKEHVTTRDGQPHNNPHTRVDCDGLPNDTSGQRINSFNIFDRPKFGQTFDPDSLVVGKTYEITGTVSSKYFNLKDILGEVAGAVAGVDGVPKDKDHEIALNTALAAASRIIAAMTTNPAFWPGSVPERFNAEGPSEVAGTFDYIYRQILATRFNQEDHPTDESDV